MKQRADRPPGLGSETGAGRRPPRLPRLGRRNAVGAAVAALVASGAIVVWWVGGSGSAHGLPDGVADPSASATARPDGPPIARGLAGERRPSRYARQDSHWWARDYDASIEASLEILAIDPRDVQALYSLGFAQGMRGRNAAATMAFRRAVRLAPDDPNLVALAWGHARAGERDSALEALGKVEGPDALLREIALVHGALGDPDRAFACLERAYELDPESLESLHSDPTADALRSDRRFARLLERLEAT